MNWFFWRKKIKKSEKLVSSQLQYQNDDGTWTNSPHLHFEKGRKHRYVEYYSTGRVSFDYEVGDGGF